MPRFVHLHTHTEFSLIDGLVRIKPLIKAVQAAQMPACAVTDFSNLCGLVQFYKAANGAGVKPIVGSDILIENGNEPPSRLVLLCQDKQGYINLSELVSLGYLEGLKKDVPHVCREWFEGRTEGLIVLSAGRLGDVGQALLANNHDQAKQYLQFWQTHFPNRFYLELQRTGRPQEEEYIHAAVQLAIETQTPVVATNDVVFLKEDDYEAHEVRVCIHDGYVLDDNRRPRIYSTQQYLRSPEEMSELFSDIPEAIENTWRIAQRCNIELTLGKNYLPDFPVPEGMTMDEYFCDLSRKGLDYRFETVLKDKIDQRQEYDERLQIELDVILQMGFPGYFLIVADFIQWSKDNDVPVGPGRGSGAGSIVAYALKITDLDPIEYDLLFERFLNPERVSMPDFDIDFCMEGRDRVIQYVAETYGKEHVSQIITFGTMAAKAVVRDVGRVLGHPYPFVDQISKLIPFEIGITLTKAREQEEQLEQRYQNDEDVKAIIDMALKLEGLTRNVGTHAGGVVIGPSALTDFCPLYWDGNPENTMVTQLDKNDVETIGLVKFDFLGLRTLTIIKWALENIVKIGGDAPDMLEIPLDDNKAFDLLKKAQTTAVFQLESRGMKELIKRLLPDCFEDIVALVALFRPGPLQSGMVDDFINRKHGLAEIEYPHPDLEPILKPTYGVILYQEQVMQIAQVLASYTLGGADLLRRAMGKKKPEEMAKQRTIFTEGALKRDVKEETATYIFNLMEKFAGYGFNKCVIGSTLIANPDTGELLTVKSLFENGIKQVASLQSDKKMDVSNVVQVMENGIKSVFQLTTATGKQITATDNHPFLTIDGWKPLAELQADQRIASPSYLPIEGNESWEASIFEDIKPHQLLPENIFKLKSDALDIFIQSYWSKFGDLETEKPYIQTTSKPLLHQLQHLLLRLGIVCYVEELKENNNLISQFCLTPTNKALFLKSENDVFQTNGDNLETSNTDIFWETIVSIEPAGSEMTYDLEVQDTHNFVANDLIIHNSHSAAYAFVSYQTAWLKAHYPAAFMAAVLSSDMDNTDKVVGLIDDCREMKLEVKPPHVNYCDYKFTIADNQTILYGLGAIKGVGENAIENIVISRKENREFKDLFDFCKKIDLRKVNRRVLEALVKSGCFDNMGASRATLTASLDTATKLAEKHASDKNTGQNSLFAMFDAPEEKTEEKAPYAENAIEWTDIQRLNGEKDCLGLYLTGHPIDQYKKELEKFSYTSLSKVRPTNRGATAKVIGLSLGVRVINSRRGKMAIVQLDDNTGRMDATMFSTLYTEVQHKLQKDTILVIEGEVREDEYSGGFTMNASSVMTFPEAREKSARYMAIQVEQQQVKQQFTQDLLNLLQTNKGRCPIVIRYQNKDAEVKLKLGGQWAVMPSDDFINQLENLIGRGKVHFEYF